MTNRWCGLAGLAVMAAASAGCLLKDRTDTWYLEPAGTVTWSIVEKDVRSDAAAAADRQNEELTYISGVRSQTHAIARAFGQLGPTAIRTRILRGSVPYSVVTDATFAGLDSLGLRLIARTRLTGSSVIQRSADGIEWTFSVKDPHAQDAADVDDEDINDLVGNLSNLQIVIVQGQFVSAQGFTLSKDSRVATFDQDRELGARFEDGGQVILKLKWTAK